MVPLPPGLSVVFVSIFYLHGFASSPKSTKVAYFAERFCDHGIALQCPDLNQPDFRTMTMTRMIEQLTSEIARLEGRATLIGSSLGGTLAILVASMQPARIDRVVLLAPAVMFAKPGHHLLPPERVEEWRRQGALPFFHYADGAERLLDYGFYQDSLQYDAFGADLRPPTLIFQGLHDTSVDCRTVEAFARSRPNARLSMLDDDHQLITSLPTIWNDVAPFLGLVA